MPKSVIRWNVVAAIDLAPYHADTAAVEIYVSPCIIVIPIGRRKEEKNSEKFS